MPPLPFCAPNPHIRLQLPPSCCSHEPLPTRPSSPASPRGRMPGPEAGLPCGSYTSTILRKISSGRNQSTKPRGPESASLKINNHDLAFHSDTRRTAKLRSSGNKRFLLWSIIPYRETNLKHCVVWPIWFSHGFHQQSAILSTDVQ